MGRCSVDEGLAHVNADFRDNSRIAAMGGEIGGERRDRGAVLAFGREQNPALVQIGEQGHIVMAPGYGPGSWPRVMAPAGRGFGEGDPCDPDPYPHFTW